MRVIRVNACVHVVDGLPGELQSLGTVPTFIVLSFLQFFRGRLQVAKSFLHVRLIFAERISWHQQNQGYDEGNQNIC
jgi:hypothetical protein